MISWESSKPSAQGLYLKFLIGFQRRVKTKGVIHIFFLIKDSASAFDWSQPVETKEDELELKWDDDQPEDDESPPMSMKLDKKENVDIDKEGKNTKKNFNSIYYNIKFYVLCFIVDETTKTTGQLDIMAQQLKFVACLKILMEELSTLATGFEVDGGQLRYQLYVWLEREVDALRQLCNYSANTDGDTVNATDCNSIF